MPSTAIGARPDLYEATRLSLLAAPKELPAVWLYDERGSQLYEEITRLPEYYLPRREAEILRVRSALIAERSRARTLVELGSGNARNTRFLLDALSGTLERFVPFDVSERTLRTSAQEIASAYPAISVEPIAGDFERDLGALPDSGPRLVAFLGSTIGNLYPEQRARFLRTLGSELGPEDLLLLGLDLVKDAVRLQAAYDDTLGVTEAFVRNALAAANRELGATFEQSPVHLRATLGPRERVDGHRPSRVAGAQRLGPASRAGARVRRGRAAARRGQLEVPAAEVRGGARARGIQHRGLVDGRGRRLRGRSRPAR